MSLKHVNAVVVGAGAGGGIVAKELAEAGLSVVLLERGKWYTAFDCRKDDLRNQRTSVLGAGFGPDDERYRRVFVDLQGHERWCFRATAFTATTPPAWAAVRPATARWHGVTWKKTSACAPPMAPSRTALLTIGPSATPISNRSMRKRSGKSEFRGTIRATLSALRARNRCPCHRFRPGANTRS